MGQYVAWTTEESVVDPGDFSEVWEEFNDYVFTFYRNEKANKYFRKFIKSIVTRKNKYNGLFYFEDPTIMAWQLANEPRPGNGEEGVKHINSFYKWVDETAGFIHQLDSNHLVTTGNEGLMGILGKEEFYLNTHKLDNIDYATFHLWAKNWGWFKADQMEETYPRSEENAIEYINKHFQFAKKLNKPITLEEFGFPRDYEKTMRGTSTTYRDRYYKKIFEIVSDSAKAGVPIAGTNFWTWGGEGSQSHEDAIWREGDPFTGDPPQEPQGLNSVFSSDSSTLKIIKKHGSQMRLLREN